MNIFKNTKTSKPKEILLVSLLSIPFFLVVWYVVSFQIALNIKDPKVYTLTTLIVLYILTVIIYQKGKNEKKYNINIVKNVKNYLVSKKWDKISFEIIQEKINAKYTKKDVLKAFANSNLSTIKYTLRDGKEGIKLFE